MADFWGAYNITANTPLTSDPWRAQEAAQKLANSRIQNQVAMTQMEAAKLKIQQERDLMANMKALAEQEQMTMEEVARAEARAGQDPANTLKAAVDMSNDLVKLRQNQEQLGIQRFGAETSRMGVGLRAREIDQRAAEFGADLEMRREQAAQRNRELTANIYGRAAESSDPGDYVMGLREAGIDVPAPPRKKGEEWVSETGQTFTKNPRTDRYETFEYNRVTGKPNPVEWKPDTHGRLKREATATELGPKPVSQRTEEDYQDFYRANVEPAVKGFVPTGIGIGILSPGTKPEDRKALATRAQNLAIEAAERYKNLGERHVRDAVSDLYRRASTPGNADSPIPPEQIPAIIKANPDLYGTEENQFADAKLAAPQTWLQYTQDLAANEFNRTRARSSQLREDGGALAPGVGVSIPEDATPADLSRMIEELARRRDEIRSRGPKKRGK